MLIFEFLPVIALGVACGLIIGIIPGIGPSSMLLMLYPWLMTLEPWSCIMFYICLIQASQFSSSVAALGWNLMGELTSGPAIKERSCLHANSAIGAGMRVSATSSFVAAMLSVCICGIFVTYYDKMLWLLRSEIQLLLTAFFLVLVVCWKQNHVWISALLVVLGVLLGMVGHNPLLDTDILSFGLTSLHAGIPFIPLMTGLIIIPLLWQIFRSPIDTSAKVPIDIKHDVHIPWSSVARGSTVGFVMGLVPYIGTIFSSQVSHAWEKRHYRDTTVDHGLRRLAAAEGANNAASISVLLPFLLFGIVMQSSEAILYQLISNKAWAPNETTVLMLTVAMIAIVITAVISWLCCHVWTKVFDILLTKLIRYLVWISLLVICALNFWFGNNELANHLWVSTLISSTIIALTLNKIDFTPAIIGFLLSPILISKTVIVYNLHFV